MRLPQLVPIHSSQCEQGSNPTPGRLGRSDLRQGFAIPPDHNQDANMKTLLLHWQVWAVLSACFAALTAIFGKIGVENINSDFATLIRTVVILMVAAAIVCATGAYQSLGTISRRTYLFLGFSGLATGASWLCY